MTHAILFLLFFFFCLVLQVRGPKRSIATQGPKSGWGEPWFSERTRRCRTHDDGVVLDTRSIGTRGEALNPQTLRNRGTPGDHWRWRKIGRIPISDQMRPTTVAGTKTGLRFSVELGVEVVFNFSGPGCSAEDEKVKVAILYKNDVHLSS